MLLCATHDGEEGDPRRDPSFASVGHTDHDRVTGNRSIEIDDLCDFAVVTVCVVETKEKTRGRANGFGDVGEVAAVVRTNTAAFEKTLGEKLKVAVGVLAEAHAPAVLRERGNRRAGDPQVATGGDRLELVEQLEQLHGLVL